MSVTELPVAGRSGLAEVIEPPVARARHTPRTKAARRGRWPAYLLVVSGVALVPWLVILAVTRPSMTVAWVGMDAMEALALIATGLLALRGHPLRGAAAAATAALLVVDAWFDTTTAASTPALLAAVAMAVVAELPLAALCLRLAHLARAPRRG
jgi:hypothetical protein